MIKKLVVVGIVTFLVLWMLIYWNSYRIKPPVEFLVEDDFRGVIAVHERSTCESLVTRNGVYLIPVDPDGCACVDRFPLWYAGHPLQARRKNGNTVPHMAMLDNEPDVVAIYGLWSDDSDEDDRTAYFLIGTEAEMREVAGALGPVPECK